MRDLRPALRAARPLVHCITNPIAIGDQANIVLAAGGRPIMAEHPDEVEAITADAGALLLNLGNITEVRIRSMERAAAAAARAGVPVTLDLVGVGCSALRREFALRLLAAYPVAVVRGNLSEALAALGRESHALGVDAGDRADGATQAEVARTLAKEYSAAALVSGPVDAVSDGERVALIPGGCELMGRITGTGCMQGALVAAFTAVAEPFDAAAFGAALLARAGEAEAAGPMALRFEMIDRVYALPWEEQK